MQMLELQVLFPGNNEKHHAVTGRIPMSYFVANESAIRAACKEYFDPVHGYRVIYRGPRVKKNSSMTRRADATHALLYWR